MIRIKPNAPRYFLNNHHLLEKIVQNNHWWGEPRKLHVNEDGGQVTLGRATKPTPYKLTWMHNKDRLIVPFSVGPYKDQVLCDAILMTATHLLLRQPWFYDARTCTLFFMMVRVSHDVRTCTLFFLMVYVSRWFLRRQKITVVCQIHLDWRQNYL